MKRCIRYLRERFCYARDERAALRPLTAALTAPRQLTSRTVESTQTVQQIEISNCFYYITQDTGVKTHPKREASIWFTIHARSLLRVDPASICAAGRSCDVSPSSSPIGFAKTRRTVAPQHMLFGCRIGFFGSFLRRRFIFLPTGQANPMQLIPGVWLCLVVRSRPRLARTTGSNVSKSNPRGFILPFYATVCGLSRARDKGQ